MSRVTITEPVLNPETWIDEYGDYLFRYAMSRLRDTTAAEEVVQETLLSGIRYQQQFAGRGSERAWLLGILKRKIIDYVRMRSKYHQRYEDEADPTVDLFDQQGRWKKGAWPNLSPDSNLSMEELWHIVKQCLETLPKSQADVFVLSVMEEMDTPDICRQLEITPSNFWVRLHRARVGLAKCVGSQWFDDEGPAHGK